MPYSPKSRLEEKAEIVLRERERQRDISLSHRNTFASSDRERFSSQASAIIALIVIFVIIAIFIIFYRYIF